MTDINTKLVNAKIEDVPEFSLNGVKTVGKVVDIYDGDTCKIILVYKNELMRFNCRLVGLDTPEIKPSKDKVNRDQEIKNAHRCRNKLMQLTTSCNCEIEQQYTKKEIKNLLDTNNKVITVLCHEFDKYGRLLVELYYDSTKTANTILVEENFAKSYDGGTKDEFVY